MPPAISRQYRPAGQAAVHSPADSETPMRCLLHRASVRIPLQVLLYSADDYIKGYIEGILQAQLRVYGYYFINELITNDLLDAINQSFRKIGQTTLTLNRRGLSFAIASEITNLERSFLLEQMGELFNTHFTLPNRIP